MRTSNPTLKESIFQNTSVFHGEKMTIDGTINKSFILLALVMITAIYTWQFTGPSATFVIFGGLIIGLITAIITVFKKEWSAYTAPVYAIAQGAFLGAISAMFNLAYPGIVIQAVGLTFGVFLIMLFLYKTRVIRVTEQFRLIIISATGAVMLLYLVNFALSFFGINIPMIHSNGVWGIAFSVFVVGLAAFNLALDFDFIEKGSKNSVAKYMEWYASFGLLVTLVWLYIEILRLLSKLRSR